MGNPNAFDRSTETFAVPENTNTFFVNDGLLNPGDLTTAPGSVRNTGKLASSPKPFPNNILSIYSLGSNQTLTIDAGNYALLAPLVVSNTSGLGNSEGFTMLGPSNPNTPATLGLANPLTHAPVVELTGADFMTLEHLTMTSGQYGLLVDNSTHFTGSNLTVDDNLHDGLLLTPSVIPAALDHITSFSNGGSGINAQAGLVSLSNSTAYGNVANGVSVTNAGSATIEANTIYGNGGYGLLVTNNVPATTTVVGNADVTKGRGNKVYGNFGNGISANGSVLVAGNTVNGQVNANDAGLVLMAGAQAEDNAIFGNSNGIVATGAAVTSNRVYHNSNVGILANGGDRLLQNVVYSNATGIQSYNTGNSITNDLVYANSTLGIGVHNGPDTSVVNNTVFQPLGDALDIDGGSTAAAVKNNILWSQTGYDLAVATDSQTGFASDFNDLYVSGAGNVGLWQSGTRATLTAWQGATVNDLDSLSHDPLFVNPAGAEGAIGYVDTTHDGSDDDFHEQSQIGSFHGGALAPIVSSITGLPVFPAATVTADASQSPTIDRGAASDSFANEPAPNGEYINQGAYGNTSQASESPTSYVLVMSPSGGESWPKGNTFTIRWRSQDMQGTVRIDLLEGSSTTPAFTIGTGIANTGSYTWTVPTSLTPAGDYSMRVTREDAGAASGVSASAFSIAPPVTVYYVNDGTVNPGDWTTAPGNDANDGLTPATPKATIQAVLLAYHPGYGDMIRVDAGTYSLTSNIQLSAVDSGVTIVGYNNTANPAAHAALDRGNQNDGSVVFELTGGNDVTLDHLEMTDAALGVQANDTGSQRLTVSNCDIYGNRVGGINLFGYSVTNAVITGNQVHDNNPNYAGGFGITVAYGGGHVISNNIVFDHYGAGISASPGSNVAGYTINGNTVYANGNGISAGGTGTFIVNNTAYNNNFGFGIGVGPGAVAMNNTAYGQTAGGGASEGIELFGGEARNNTVYGNYNGITGAGLYDGNRVFDNSHAGIVATGGSTVSGNTVYSNDHGIEADSSFGGPYLNHNLVYANTTYGIGVHGARSTVTNNTIYQPTGDALIVDSGSVDVQVENNILWAVVGHDLTISPDSEIGFQSDYNDLVTADGNLLGNWEGRDYTNRVDWSYELGFDQHSITADPQFVNPAGPDGVLGYGPSGDGGSDDDFHILGSSPTIDAGDPSSAFTSELAPNGGRINLGYDGNTSAATASTLQFVQELSPAGLEKSQVGQTVAVQWRTVGISADTVNIDLLRDGDPTFDETLANHVADTSEFDWKIPANQPLAGDYRIRISISGGIQPQAVTPQPFLIANSGHDYYVNDASTTGDVFTTAVGNDANSGKSPDQPVASLAALLTAYHFAPGDLIHVDTGTYNVTINLRLTAQDSGVTIVGPSTSTALFNRGNSSSGTDVFELDGAINVTLEHLTATGGNNGIYVPDLGSTGLTVSNCDVYGNAYDGIWLYGYSLTNGQITNNLVHDNGGASGIAIGSGAGMVVTGNTVYHNHGDGITAAPGTNIPGYTVAGNTAYGNNNGIDAGGSGTVVQNNTVYSNTLSGVELSGGAVALDNMIYGQVVDGAASQGIYLLGGEARGNSIFDNYNGILGAGMADENRVYHNLNAGIALTGGSVITENQVYSNDHGIEADSSFAGPYVNNNLVYANAKYGIGVHAAESQVFNNTVYQPTGDALVVDNGSRNVLIENNVLWTNAGHDLVASADESELNLQSDFNDLYTTGTGVLGQWEGTDFTTRAAWFYQVGLDQHSIVADPQFANAVGTDGVLGYSSATTAPAQIVDDASSAFSVSGSWTTQPNGDGGSEHVSNGGNDDVATWTINNLTPGAWYQVAATWSSGGTSSGAPFTIRDGNQLLASPVVDQTSAPGDFNDAGLGWKTLGTFYVSSGTLIVTVTHTPGYYPNVLADAVRVQGIIGDHGADDNFHLLPSSPAIDAGDLTTLFANEPVPSGGRVNLGNYGNTPDATPMPLPEVQVLSPAGLDKFQVGQTVPITWRTVGVDVLAGTVNIDLDVGGASIMNIATGAPDNGSFAWTVPAAALGGGYQIQVHVNDGAQPTGLSHDTFLVANNGHDYYINDSSTTGDVFTTTAGNDANSGKTPDAPMATLRAMLLAYDFQPGDVIHVDTGNYRLYRNLLIVPQDSGVTIQGPATAEALLNRGNQNAGADVIDLAGGTHVTLDHLSISGGVNGIMAPSTANSSYVTISNDDIKNNSQYAVYLDASNDHAVLSGNSVHDNTLRGYPNPPYPAIYVAAADGLIDNNQVFGDAAGIQVVYRGGEADRIVVSNNVVRDNDAIGISGSSDVLITGNNIYNNTTGIYLYNETQRNAGQASQNIVHDNQEGFLTDSFLNAYGMTISDNRVYHNSVDGIHLFGSMQAIGNKVYSNPIGILGDNNNGNALFSGVIDNNLVYANTNEAIVLKGVLGAQVDNNDLYQPVGDAIDLTGGAKNVQIYNNIAWVLGGYDVNVATDSTTGLKSDYNLFNKGPAANAHVGFYSGATQDGLGDWQAASGLDSHSQFADPKWVDIAGADSVLGYTTANGGSDGGADDNFYLSAGSPAIDRGYSWPALSTDMFGVTRQDDPGTTNAGSPDYVETQLASSLFSTGGTPQNFHAGPGGSSFVLNLPFAFPFYDGSYTSVTVSSRGFLEFAGTADPSDGANSDTKLASSRILAPFWANLRTDASGDDVFVDTSVAKQITIRWQATSVADGSAASFDVVLFQDGHFRFDYGAGNANQSPTIGASFGNGQISVLLRYDSNENLNGARSVEFDFQPGIVDVGAIEFTASSLQTTPPSVTGISPAVIGSGGSTGDPISSLHVTFSEPVNPLDANSPAVYELRKAGSNGFGSPDDVIYTLVPQYLPGSTSAALATSGLPSSGLPVGNYRFTIFSGAGASVHDLAGLGLDGDANGTPGGDYVRTFSIAPPQADLNVSATVDQSTALEGELLHFTISVDDVAGPQAANQIVIAAPLPAGLTFVGDNLPVGSSYDSTTGTWSIANLAKGSTDSLVLSATVNAGTLGQALTLSAAIKSAGEPDPNPNNNQASAPVTIVSSADLAISQSLDDPQPIEGEVIHYTFTLANQAGPEAAGATMVSIALPFGVTFSSATPAAGTTFASGVWTVPGLAVGGSATLVIAAEVNAATVTTTLSSVATITSEAQPEPNVTNNASTLNTVVQPGADIAVSQTVSSTQPGAGQPVQFTVSVHNIGPESADDVIIVDLLPDGLNVLSYQTTSGQFTSGGGEGDEAGVPQWYLLDLPAGGNATLSVTVAADADQVGQTLTNIAGLAQLDELDKNAANNNSSATITVSSRALSATALSVAATEATQFNRVVATFSDSDAQDVASDFSANINWGDGGKSAGSITFGTDNLFTVAASHSYAEEGTEPVTISIAHTSGATVTAQTTADILDVAVAATGLTAAVAEAATFSGAVATFTDPAGAEAIGNYTATINWGDGSTTPSAAITLNAGVFTVSGTHTYVEEGAKAPVLTIAHDAASPVTVTASIVVSDASLSGVTTASAVGGIEDVTPATLTAATFTDSNVGAPASDFSISAVNWGDGSTTATGLNISGSGGSYTLTGSHLYSEDGVHNFSITVKDAGGSTATLSGTANVADAGLDAAPAGIAAMEDATFSGAVATFVDTNRSAPASDYSATIDWGDGTRATTVSGGQMSVANGTYTVAASHVYAIAGTYNAVVTVSDVGSARATARDTVVVTPAATTASGSTVNGTVGTAVSATVAAFSHGDGRLPAADFSATIDWGDGQTSAGTVSAANAAYTVAGTHTYTRSGTYAVAITIVEGRVATVAPASAIIVSTTPFHLVEDVYAIGSGIVHVSAADGVLANDMGPSQLTVTTGAVTGANGGNFAFNADGSFTYTPGSAFPGFDYAQYAAKDIVGDQGSVTVYVLSSTGALVWKFYESMLDRAPDNQGLGFWIMQFNNGAALSQIAVNFFAGDELQTRVITDYYLQYLGRQPDQPGLAYWKNKWTATGGPEDVQAGFANSPEFTAQNGNTPNGWITGLYEKILNRPPEQQGLNYWIGQVEQLDTQDGKSFVDDADARFEIADRILKSQERYQDIIVPGWFDQFIQGQPTSGQVTQYVNELLSGTPDRTVEEQIIDNAGVTNDVPSPSAETAVALPDFYYVPPVERQNQAVVAAKDAVFSQLGG